MSNPSPFFSIIIPTRNESRDILPTLESIRDCDFQDFEVLVVDASEDNTPRLVIEFGNPRFRLLSQNNRDGRCGARNQGIRAACGEVVIILNADVRLPRNFLSRLKVHYDHGADYVIVEARVENTAHPFAAMVAAEHEYFYRSGREIVNWCEGYSCRRTCAIEAGLFPEGLPVPICAGEDAVFSEKVARLFHRQEDSTLVVSHAVPEDFDTFWGQRVGRGQGCSQRRILLEGHSIANTTLETLGWTIRTFMWIALVFPILRYTWRLTAHVPKTGSRHLLHPVALSRVAHEIGRWKGLFQVCRALRSRRHDPKPIHA